jgi:hypothetical protein
MTTKTILAVSFAAVFVISMAALPAFAAPNGFLTIKEFTTAPNADDATLTDVHLTTKSAIPKNGNFGAVGYAFLHSGVADLDNVLVVVTHLGFDDSTPQTGPQDPEVHNHVLDLIGATSACAGNDVEVDLPNSGLNPDFDPDYPMTIHGNKLWMFGVDTSTMGPGNLDSAGAVAFVASVPSLTGGVPDNICVDVIGFGVGL